MKSSLAMGLGILWMVLFSSGCIHALPKSEISGGRTYKAQLNIRANGFRRSYLVHLPPDYPAGGPLPMVVVIHGAFDNALGMERVSGFSDLADREKFIAVYPNGFGLFGKFQHWNAGHCCGKAAAIELNDVGYLEAVIEDISARMAVDRSRIYMTGFSNGGMMTYYFAAERGSLLAAVAPLAAVAGGRSDDQAPRWSLPRPVSALPVLTMHGSADDDIPFAGGLPPTAKDGREFWSVQQSLDVWIERNHCHSEPLTQAERDGRIRVTQWPQCRDNVEVILYELIEWDHRWPGLQATADLPADDPLRGFDAARVVWDFFKRHRRGIE